MIVWFDKKTKQYYNPQTGHKEGTKQQNKEPW